MNKKLLIVTLISLVLSACQQGEETTTVVVEEKQAEKPLTLDFEKTSEVVSIETSDIITPNVADIYAQFTLSTDLSHLSTNQKLMLPILIEISTIMDELFWLQSYGDKDSLLSSIDNTNLKRLVDINYGPWDRLNGDAALIAKYGEKALGANFYPKDMSKEEFEASDDANKANLYTDHLHADRTIRIILIH